MSRLANANNRTKLIKALKRAGYQIHEGGKHSIVTDADGAFLSTVPRTREMNVNTLRAMLKQVGLSEQEYLRLYR